MKTMAKSAMSAWLMKCLVPLSTQSPPSCDGGRLHAAQVGAGAGLGHGQAVRLLAADAGKQVLLALLRRAGEQDVRGPRHAGPVQRVVGAAELLLVEQPGHRIEPGAADLGRHVGGIEPGGDRLGLELVDQLAAQHRRCARPPARADRARSRRRRASSRRSASALRTGRNPWRQPFFLPFLRLVGLLRRLRGLGLCGRPWQPSASSPPAWQAAWCSRCAARRRPSPCPCSAWTAHP